jgi:hypothetical protein
MKRLLTEPLVHFLILGAALFAAYGLIDRKPEGGGEQVVVTAGQVEHLATTFAKVWQRPPTQQELKGLIDEHVKEEILSREAVKLGLDQNDTIIRRRLRQKMEFLAEDFAATQEPTDDELEAYLREHPDAFREAPRFTFRHIFLSDDRGENLKVDADALLAQLKADPLGDPSELGDRFLGPGAFTNEPWQGVASQLGHTFPEQLNAAPVGEWAGPISSGYGAHLVLVSARTEGRLPPLEEVRDDVKRELLVERRLRTNQAFLDALLARYQVTIDWRGGANDPEVRGVSLAK